METINFQIQGRHESHSGEATIVESYRDGLRLVDETFTGQFKTNKIGVIKDGPQHDAEKYAIYENYQDSGSNDYIYFALKLDE